MFVTFVGSQVNPSMVVASLGMLGCVSGSRRQQGRKEHLHEAFIRIKSGRAGQGWAGPLGFAFRDRGDAACARQRRGVAVSDFLETGDAMAVRHLAAGRVAETRPCVRRGKPVVRECGRVPIKSMPPLCFV